jgi:NitT/TauT family transport system ATP-binding protein
MSQSKAGSTVEIRGVTKIFDGTTVPAIDGITLTVPAGEFVCLLGPSGCGKTTLLRIVAGLLEQTAGDVVVGGEVSTGPSRDKAVVFQHFNLFPWRTVLANVVYGLEMQGIGREERRATGLEYLNKVGLVEYADSFPGQLSGGMRQRVGIARALAIKPRLLLMDEPFGALDALTREYMQHEMEALAAEAGTTTLFVTHSLDEALFLADRVVVMGRNPGRIVMERAVPFERPRADHDFRSSPEYTEMRAEVWALLEHELRGGDEVARQRGRLAGD